MTLVLFFLSTWFLQSTKSETQTIKLEKDCSGKLNSILNCLKLFLCSLFDLEFGPFIWVDKKWCGPQITHLYRYHMSNLKKKLLIKQTNFVLVSKLLACEAHIIREFSARSLIVHDRPARRRRWPSYRRRISAVAHIVYLCHLHLMYGKGDCRFPCHCF